MKVGKMTPLQYEEFRKEFPYRVSFTLVLDDRSMATKQEIGRVKEFFAQIGSNCKVNRNTAYFASEKDAVFFKLGLWK